VRISFLNTVLWNNPVVITDKKHIRNSTAEFLIFSAQSGGDGLEVRYEDESIWLSQKLMAWLFDVTVPTINEHLKNIFEQGEVDQDSVIRKFRITADDGKSYNTQHYNLDAIISVGYRVNSVRATQFRQWATEILRDFAIKGYVLDQKRMENGTFLDEDYFERLLEEIREKHRRPVGVLNVSPQGEKAVRRIRIKIGSTGAAFTRKSPLSWQGNTPKVSSKNFAPARISPTAPTSTRN